ncbi:hypothetical protein EVAR_80856_1 [Eumeta japonica]|uniref:Uncharacterized protein n=1 Tax=Eumeta variegata TaxID=151549 RepID=A0A4C1V0Q7_EUMVA|nr:hypothetical protein EVAR_80856_1 [Eumeta japonica]
MTNELQMFSCCRSRKRAQLRSFHTAVQFFSGSRLMANVFICQRSHEHPASEMHPAKNRSGRIMPFGFVTRNWIRRPVKSGTPVNHTHVSIAVLSASCVLFFAG